MWPSATCLRSAYEEKKGLGRGQVHVAYATCLLPARSPGMCLREKRGSAKRYGNGREAHGDGAKQL